MRPFARCNAMKHALPLALLLFAAPAFAQDATFDVEAADPAIEAELTETEEELAEFFEDEPDFRPEIRYTPDADARTEAVLLERAEREMGEFNDIDADDDAEVTRLRSDGALPRLEKPGQLEKDFAIDCPAGTREAVDGSCVAGPDFRFD